MSDTLVECEPIAEPKRVRTCGKPPKITKEMIDRIIQRRTSGVPLSVAVSMEYPPVPFEHYQKTLERTPFLRAYAAQKEGEAIKDTLDRMQTLPAGQWQRLAWLLERCFGFAAPKSGGGTQVNVTVNTCIGLAEDIAKRAASVISVRSAEEKASRPPKQVKQ